MTTSNKSVSFNELLLQQINTIKREKKWSFSYTINFLCRKGMEAANTTTTTINNRNSIKSIKLNKKGKPAYNAEHELKKHMIIPQHKEGSP